MFGYPPHSDRSNTPDYYQTHCTVNNRGVLQGFALPNVQWQGLTDEDPFRKCSAQNCLRTLYRLTYIYIHRPANRYIHCVLIQKDSSCFASLLLFLCFGLGEPRKLGFIYNLCGRIYGSVVVQVGINQTVTPFVRVSSSKAFSKL